MTEGNAKNRGFFGSEATFDFPVWVLTSEELLTELRRKVIQKFPLFTPELELLEASIRKDAILISLGVITLKVSRDPDDDKFLETALLGNCGDKDLLSLGTYQGIKMAKPAEFLHKYFSRIQDID